MDNDQSKFVQAMRYGTDDEVSVLIGQLLEASDNWVLGTDDTEYVLKFHAESSVVNGRLLVEFLAESVRYLQRRLESQP